jgi:hypothetical protein
MFDFFRYTQAGNTLLVIGATLLLLGSLGFVGWAVYDSMQKNEPTPLVTESVAETHTTRSVPATPPPPGREAQGCPLDGTEMEASAEETTRAPVIVQIDNAPAARPQEGISKADIVYEALAEGDVTRYSAIFQCHDAEVVGPVRSARLVDLELVPQYQALLADSGASTGVTNELDADPTIPNISQPNYPGAYWRTSDRYMPHNMMTTTEGIRQAAESSGYDITADLEGFPFKDAGQSGGQVTSISIPYSSWADVSYSYDPGSNGWRRSIGGEADIDALTEEQITPMNVIVQFVPSYASDIVEDSGGNLGLIFDLTGSGRALIFRDGNVIDGQWERPSSGAMTTFSDGAGREVKLNRGQTWIQLVPTNFTGVDWS